MRFQGKVIIVTGAAMGIGKAAAKAFAQEGGRVALVDIDAQAAAKALEELYQIPAEAIYLPCDVSKEADVRSMVEHVTGLWGRLDVLVNNAGIYRQGNILEATGEDWDRILSINLTGAFLCSKYAAEFMVHQGQGVIVNVASEAGLVGIGGQVAYNVSKAGMINLTRSCAVDLARFGVRVNCVCPGTTFTPLVEAAVNRAADPQQARHLLESVRPMNRLGKVEEIASGILFMASDEPGYATGAVLSIDGGFTAQ
jgi:NAD(P)-dependent dehydrogenase (short-subunit alcohol dehydrogenase family)